MKPFLYERESQLRLIDKIRDVPEPKQIKAVIQEVYDEFSISEKSFKSACKEIDISFRMLADLKRSWRGMEICNEGIER